MQNQYGAARMDGFNNSKAPRSASHPAGEGGDSRKFYPIPLKLHKRTMQLEMSFRPPSKDVDSTGRVIQKQGAIYLSMAKALDDAGSKMDWDRVITMKLGISDVAKIATGIRMQKYPIDLVHSVQRGKTTSLKIEPGSPGTFKWAVFKKENDQTDSRFLYLQHEDLYLILTLIDAAVPQMMAWSK